jgi:uncharacterized protein YjbJ (UPF0337 family)
MISHRIERDVYQARRKTQRAPGDLINNGDDEAGGRIKEIESRVQEAYARSRDVARKVFEGRSFVDLREPCGASASFALWRHTSAPPEPER